MENRYRDAVARYLNRNSETISEPEFQEYLDLLYPQKKTVYEKAAESKARYGNLPTIRSAGEHVRSLNPVLRKLLGL